MRSKIYLHTEISIFFAFGFWINRRGKRFIKKINRSSKSVQRREYHQPVSFIWSFSLCYFPPFSVQSTLIFDSAKNIVVYCLSLDVMCLTKTNGPNNSICVYFAKGSNSIHQKVKRVHYTIFFIVSQRCLLCLCWPHIKCF